MTIARELPAVTDELRERHARMMEVSGATGRPEDYRDRLSYLFPFEVEQRVLLAFCGCCQAPLEVSPALGLWVSWQASRRIAPMCALCLEILRRSETATGKDATLLVLGGYDSMGDRHRAWLDTWPLAELAQLRLAEVETSLPRVQAGPLPWSVSTIAWQAFLESAGTLDELMRIWNGQRAFRLRLGRKMIELHEQATEEALEGFSGLVADVPGALQAWAEARAVSATGLPQ